MNSHYSTKQILSRFTLGLVILSTLGAAILAGNLLIAAPAKAACGALPTSFGTDSINLSVPTAGAYRVWVRELAPSSSTSGFYLQIPDAGICQDTMGNAAIPANTWTWVDYQNANAASIVSATLSSGSHNMELAGLHSGTEVDKVELLTDTTCTPNGDGTNCDSSGSASSASGSGTGSSSAPTSVSVTGSSAPTVSKNISLAAPSGITDIHCFIDNKPVNCSNIDTTKLSDGKHTVKITGLNANGTPYVHTSTIYVKNHLNALETVLADARSPRTWFGVVAVLIAVGIAAWYLNLRFGLLNLAKAKSPWLRPNHENNYLGSAPPSPAAPAPPVLPTGTPPPPQITYPDGYRKD